MKHRIIFLVTLLVAAIAVSAQTAKNRKNRAGTDKPYVDDATPTTKTQFFYSTILPKNDTNKMNEYLATGIDINVRATEAGAETKYYRTILMYAIENSNIVTVEYLLKHGADPNLRIRKYWETMFSRNPHYEFSMYPIEVAAEKGDIAKMDLLVKYGAVASKAIDGLKEIAANKGSTKLMNWITKQTGLSAVQKNALAIITDDVYGPGTVITFETIDQLIKGGANINAYAPSGKTALINAIKARRITKRYELASMLLKNGANPNLPDRVADDYPGIMKYYPVSPLKAAIESNDLQMVKLLVQYGANINQADGGHTPLETAKKDEIKEYLILKGAR